MNTKKDIRLVFQCIVGVFVVCVNQHFPSNSFLLVTILSATGNQRNTCIAQKSFDRIQNISPDSKIDFIAATVLLSNSKASADDFSTASQIRMKWNNTCIITENSRYYQWCSLQSFTIRNVFRICPLCKPIVLASIIFSNNASYRLYVNEINIERSTHFYILYEKHSRKLHLDKIRKILWQLLLITFYC